MTTQTVFRIQNHNGLGPYIGSRDDNTWNDKIEQILGPHNGSINHPNPCDDKGISRWVESVEKCGFLSMEDLCNWFSGEEIARLEPFGYTICPVEGEITVIGEKQILFKEA
jgi:hypothetical protein